MAKFLFRAQCSPEGLQGVVKEGFASREDYIRGLIESVGGKTEACYFSYGVDDLLVIIDAEPAAAVALSLAVNQSGAVRVNTTPLMTSSEMDAARSQLPQFRAPGAR
jgi:uncharacterized protein with GYD domain